MAQSLSLNLVHVIFSTKDREPTIADEVLTELHGFIAGVVRTFGCECFRVGGVADHVHVAMRLAVTKDAATVVSEMKSASSLWMKQHHGGFAWQRGYGLFSVGPADLDALVRYIDGQAEHHRKRSFEEEFRALLTKYHVAFDERYVWG